MVHPPSAPGGIAHPERVGNRTGIHPISMISTLLGRIPEALQGRTQLIRPCLAKITSALLLLSTAWVMQNTHELFSMFSMGISRRDMILFLGGLFLLWKSSTEILSGMEASHCLGNSQRDRTYGKGGRLTTTVAQIAIVDIVLSLDSVITAVSMAANVPVMVVVSILAVLLMMLVARTISAFIDNHPSLQILALAFLIVVGAVLVGEALEVQVPKGYAYFAMAFALVIEAMNLRLQSNQSRRRVLQGTWSLPSCPRAACRLLFLHNAPNRATDRGVKRMITTGLCEAFVTSKPM